MGAERHTVRQSFDSELGDFVDEICADLCRLESAAAAGCDPAEVSVERELALGADTFADIRVEAPGTAPFFVENKLAFTPADLADRLRRKYGQPSPAWRGAQRVSILLDLESTSRVADLERELRAAVAPGLAASTADS